MRLSFRTFVISWMSFSALAALAALAGCEDSSSSGTVTPDSGQFAFEAGAFEGGSVPEASTDGAAAVDAASEASLDGGAKPNGIRFANFSSVALDFCVWAPSDPKPAQSAFAPTGVLPGTVSAYFPFDKMGVNFNFLLTPAGAGCVTDAGFNTTTQPGNAVTHRTQWFTGTGSPQAGGFFDDAPATAGKDTLLFTRMFSINAAVEFTPPNGGAPVPLSSSVATLIDPAATGTLTADVPGQGTPAARPFKPSAGGVARVFVTGATIVVCDELAPAVGDQSDCRSGVRSP